ncbi:MAG: TRAM domain-containing protein, partial [Clostridia bacterium]|nr:TRAM domain-containing protein [Clostridia bacterium]
KEKYLEEVKMIRSFCPDFAITTDIMVGFPNETEEDFLETLNVVNEIMYDGAFTFVYSRRKGTKAYDMPNQVSEKVKKDRIMRLVERQNEINKIKSLDYVGKTVEVLCEDYDSKKKTYQGRDDRGRMIYFKSDKNLIGEFVNVKIIKTGGITLLGEI